MSSGGGGGSSSRPCPTLGLREDPNELCVGSIFEIPENHKQAALSRLEQREGSSFFLQEPELELQDGKRIVALVAVNDVVAPTFIGNLTLRQRARMAQTAAGCDGRCIDYLANIATKLRSLGVQDPHVETFLTAVRDIERLNSTDP